VFYAPLRITVKLMISIYYYASDERKIWGHIALAVAIIYATLNTAVYFADDGSVPIHAQ
jgi:hypothetical protein